MKEKNLAAAEAVFAKNAEVTELFFTDDGQAFYKYGPAKVHQREINGKKETIQRVVRAAAVGKPKDESGIVDEGALDKSAIKVNEELGDVIAAEKVKEGIVENPPKGKKK